jgi:uncharacterized SAM-binding protein YcdF (DUF218 family)
MSISLTALLALICIIIGFLIALIEGSFLFPPLVWFIAAIAINTLGGGYVFNFGGRGRQP